MKKLPYYLVDTGFFEHKIKICFSDSAFQEALKTSKITTRHVALDLGVAESHHIQQEGTQNVLIAIVFGLAEMQKYDSLEKIGIIVHECVHTVTHMFQHVGEDDTKVGDETRAYFTEYIFKQVFAAFATEEDKRERSGKGSGKVSDETNQAVIGALIQMAEHGNGGAGSDSNPKPKNPPRRTKNTNGSTKPKADPSV